MELYSHRGIGLGPENSLASIQEAKGRGIKYETDVRKSKDGELVLWHDPGLVENKPYSILQEMGIARLEDALQLNINLDLDIKDGVRGNEVLEMVERHDKVEQVIFTSFHYPTLKEIKRTNKDATVGLITEKRLSHYILPIVKDKIDIILPHGDTISKNFVESSHKCGLKVITWCPSNDKIMEKNREYGVDGIIVNL